MEIQLPSLFRERFCKNDTKPILGLKDDSSKRLIGMNPDKTEKSSQSDNFFFFSISIYLFSNLGYFTPETMQPFSYEPVRGIVLMDILY